MNSLARAVTAGLLLTATLPLAGCLVSGSSKETMTGEYVGKSTYSEIEPGVTTEKWILGVLGEPSSKTCLDDGSTLWKWAYKKDHSSSSAVFLIFGGSSRKESEGATFVQLKDGIVVKAWQD